MRNKKIVELESDLAGLEEAYTDLKEEYGKNMIVRSILSKRRALINKLKKSKRK